MSWMKSESVGPKIEKKIPPKKMKTPCNEVHVEVHVKLVFAISLL